MRNGLGPVTSDHNQPLDPLPSNRCSKLLGTVTPLTLLTDEIKGVSTIGGPQHRSAPVQQPLTRLQIQLDQAMRRLEQTVEAVLNSDDPPSKLANRHLGKGANDRIEARSVPSTGQDS